MLHSALIALHATSAVVALALGAFALRPPPRGIPALFRMYLGALWLMILFLILVVAVDWLGIDLITRALYVALAALALYTGWRGWQALEALRRRSHSWRMSYIDHIGFTLITLLAGFVIVGALDLTTMGWLAIVLGVLVILGGRIAVQRAKETIGAGPQTA